MLLSISALTKTFSTPEREVLTLQNINLDVLAGEFLTILGPSGCGKSTLFRLLAGLDEPDRGTIQLADQMLTTAQARRGKFGYMPQRDALLPWRTILDNVIVGPELAGQSRTLARQEAEALMPLFGLDGFENAWPNTLSGGMRQRAALLRTFLMGHEILLLDEPFGALDALTRRELQQWLLGVQKQFHKTILFITHDIEEAILLGDRTIVFSPRPGRIVADVKIELPHPRNEEIILEPKFLRYKRELLAMLSNAT